MIQMNLLVQIQLVLYISLDAILDIVLKLLIIVIKILIVLIEVMSQLTFAVIILYSFFLFLN